MIYGIAKLLAGLTGIDISKMQRYVVVGLIVLIGLIMLGFIIWISGGDDAKPLDPAKIEKGKQAIAERNENELREVLVKADTEEKAAQKIADQAADNTAAAEKATVEAEREARDKWAGASIEEMQADFNKRIPPR